MITQVSVRMDDQLRDEAHALFKTLGISHTDAIKGMYEYVRKNKALPFRKEILSEDEYKLLELARDRINDGTETIKVDLDDLRRTLHIAVPPESGQRV